MASHKSHKREPYYSFIKESSKVIEGRLKRGKFAKIKAGDTIEVQKDDESDSFRVKVVSVKTYRNFREMMGTENFKKIIPDAENIEDCINIYRKFYTEAQEKEYGVVGIRIKLIE